MIDSKGKKDHYKDKPLREGPLLELLRKREEKPREELLRQLAIMQDITVLHKKPNRFEVVEKVLEGQIYDEDHDSELATLVLG